MNLHAPLEWPPNIPRKRNRAQGRFEADSKPITVFAAVERLSGELARHSATGIELCAHFARSRSGNVMRQAIPALTDPGCVVRFDAKGIPYTLPCDTYSELGQNIAAIVEHLKAVRAMERHGVATTAQIMGAFASLPPPPSWWVVLKISREAGDGVVKAAYRDAAKMAHPDSPGGSEEAMERIRLAMDEAQKERPGL